MNTYLAITHVLALLEIPISIDEFTEHTQHNPLFAMGCMKSRQLLWFLFDETILEKSETGFKLGKEGLELSNYLLNWTSRDKKKVRLANIENKFKTGRGAIDTRCPKCMSTQCILHILIIILEHFYLEREERQHLSLTKRRQLLNAIHKKWPGNKLYCLWESHLIPHWPDWTDEHVQQALAKKTSLNYQLFKREFIKVSKRQLIRNESSPLELVSRLRYENGLLPPRQQQLLDDIEQGHIPDSKLIRWSLPIHLENKGLYCLYMVNREFELLHPTDFMT